MATNVAHIREGRCVCRVTVGRTGRFRPGWEDNVKRILKEEFGTVWTGFTWLRIGKSGRLL